MADVFISYARSDQAVARRLAKALENAGYSVWWDAALPAHRAYSEEIEKNLRAARAAVVLWSAQAAKSEWVRAEADLARNERKLVQASVDGTIPPLPFNQIQCADLKSWRGASRHSGFAKLLDSVRDVTTSEPGANPSSTPTSTQSTNWRKPKYLAMAAVALLVLFAAILIPRFLPGGTTERPTVAVLPFESVSKDESGLAAGMWEDTRQAISRNPQLLVLGPNSSEEIAAKGRETARKLSDYLVEAKVRTAGDRIRVSAILIRTKDDAEIWSKSFDRQLNDVFALQSEIAGEIEGHIRGRLASRGGKMPENIATSGEVYALYSDARAKIRSRIFREYPKAKAQLEEVVKRDPNFAPGWATLAVIHKLAVGSPFIKGTTPKSAEDMARRSVALAPNLAAGHAALGFALESGPSAEAALRRAIELDPNDIEALNWLANSLDRSRVEERLEIYDRIVKIEPLWWPAVMNRVNLLFQTGERAAIEKELSRVERNGSQDIASFIRIELMTHEGDLSGAAQLGLSRFQLADGQERALLEMTLFRILHQLGLHAEADRLIPPPSNYVPLIRANDPRALDMIEAQHPGPQFWTFGVLNIVGARVYVLNGQSARLARLYRSTAKTAGDFEKLIGRYDLPDVVPTVALALRQSGDAAEADVLLRLAEARANEIPANPGDQEVRLARILAVQGRKDEAIAKLTVAVGGGWLPPFLPIHTDLRLDPPLAELKDHPQFEVLRQKILRHLQKERNELGRPSFLKAA